MSAIEPAAMSIRREAPTAKVRSGVPERVVTASWRDREPPEAGPARSFSLDLARLRRVCALLQAQSLRVFCTGLGGLPLLPIGPSPMAGDADEDEDRDDQDIDAVSIPELFVAFLADGLVHLAKEIPVAHRQWTLLTLRLRRLVAPDVLPSLPARRIVKAFRAHKVKRPERR